MVPIGARDCTVMTGCFANVPSDNMEGAGFMIYVAASHQRVMFCFEFTFGELSCKQAGKFFTGLKSQVTLASEGFTICIDAASSAPRPSIQVRKNFMSSIFILESKLKLGISTITMKSAKEIYRNTEESIELLRDFSRL